MPFNFSNHFLWATKTLEVANFPAPSSKEDESYWWQHENLHRKLLRKYSEAITDYTSERDELEKKFIRQQKAIGKDVKSQEVFSNLCLQSSWQFLENWNNKLGSLPKGKWYSIYDRYWNNLNKQVLHG